MWEEPRPERLRHDKSGRNRDAFQSLMAYTVILGVAVILVKVGAINLGGKRVTAPSTPAAEVTPRPPSHGSADSRTTPDPVPARPVTSTGANDLRMRAERPQSVQRELHAASPGHLCR